MMIHASYFKELLRRWAGLIQEAWTQQRKRFVGLIKLGKTIPRLLSLVPIDLLILNQYYDMKLDIAPHIFRCVRVVYLWL